MTAYHTVKTGKMVKEYSLGPPCCDALARLEDQERCADPDRSAPQICVEDDGNVWLDGEERCEDALLFCPFCGKQLVVTFEEVPEEVQVAIEPSRSKGPGFRVRHDDGELPAELDGVFETAELAEEWKADVERGHPGWRDRLEVVWKDD